MDSWQVMTSVASVLAGCGIAVLIIGCLWPAEQPQRAPVHRRTTVGHSTRTVSRNRSWTCDLPLAPLSLEDAHQAMRHHREHDCARKKAAFATLVAAGRMTPDSSRRYRRLEVVS
ncbi:hypothetical protein [Nocardia cyriacigeorgica]|uniref:hypothetical protein n=1 Tax=Nocardia cyriacigeorgica TaxID=135487 RepID=UPI002454366D|nr:hypothetical protein [Nocardia cyriacigeorgica]